ncbi:IS66 family transposase [Mesorhizobium australicum]|uniref:IS66 family transposase n=1 Tax=Mesorhizobium australicum TaxID=536018 RepID=UPI0033372F5F
MDETTAPVLDPGRGRTKAGFLWALARDDRPRGRQRSLCPFSIGSRPRRRSCRGEPRQLQWCASGGWLAGYPFLEHRWSSCR